MGSKSNIDFGAGTIKIGDSIPVPVKNFKISDMETVTSTVEFEDEPFEYIKPIDQSAEFSFTIDGFQFTFWTRVRLFGFWRTVRAEIRRIFGRLRNG